MNASDQNWHGYAPIAMQWVRRKTVGTVGYTSVLSCWHCMAWPQTYFVVAGPTLVVQLVALPTKFNFKLSIYQGQQWANTALYVEDIQWLDDEYEIYFTSKTGFFIFNFHDCEHLGIFNGYIINKFNKLTSNKIIKSYINKTFVTQFANKIFCSA